MLTRLIKSGRWWAQVVGATHVHPHKHCANYGEKRYRRADEREGHRREELPGAEGTDHRRREAGAASVAGRAAPVLATMPGAALGTPSCQRFAPVRIRGV